MQQSIFRSELKLVVPTFDSPVMDLVIDLEKLRTKILSGTTNAYVFFQLKEIFHFMESIGSARIEGNNTTIAEYLETKIDSTSDKGDNIKEIDNIENAIKYIEAHVADVDIDKIFISDIHKLAIHQLPTNGGEGDTTPGIYRTYNLSINKSTHKPIDWTVVNDYMEELIDFIGTSHASKYDLLKIALVHHRFLWIHPFGNGNGRTARLITYAMLVKLGFNVNKGRILNPTAIFCNDREQYYINLGKADTLTEAGILNWYEYVLSGLRDEIEKIDKLANYDFLKDEILIPAINLSLDRHAIVEIEAKILKKVIEKQIIAANDLSTLLHGKSPSEISRQINNLLDKKMIQRSPGSVRKYQLRFANNFLLRSIISLLGEKGFLPLKDDTIS